MPIVSVCMAVYNGADYIEEQLTTILADLPSNSEVVIVDDCSTDSTVNIISAFSDDRIRLVVNDSNIGVNSNFEKAMSFSSGDYIFLSDQDDIWKRGRILKMMNILSSTEALLLSSAFDFIDGAGNCVKQDFLFLDEKDSRRSLKNILGIFRGSANYYGCAMLMKKELLEHCLPFPKWIESHDLWIALCANILNVNLHTEYRSLYRRLHDDNVSVVDRTLYSKIRSRVIFACHLMVFWKRVVSEGLRKNDV